jgi:hypothetical protein
VKQPEFLRTFAIVLGLLEESIAFFRTDGCCCCCGGLTCDFDFAFGVARVCFFLLSLPHTANALL